MTKSASTTDDASKEIFATSGFAPDESVAGEFATGEFKNDDLVADELATGEFITDDSVADEFVTDDAIRDHLADAPMPRVIRVLTAPRTVFWEIHGISEGYGLVPFWLGLEFLVCRPLEVINAVMLAQRSIPTSLWKLGGRYLEYSFPALILVFAAGALMLSIFRILGKERLDLWTAVSIVGFAWVPHMLVVLMAALVHSIGIRGTIIEAVVGGALVVRPLNWMAMMAEFGPSVVWLAMAVQTVFSDEPNLSHTAHAYSKAVCVAVIGLIISSVAMVGKATTGQWQSVRPVLLGDFVEPLRAKRLRGKADIFRWERRVSVVEFWSRSQSKYVDGLHDRNRLQRAYRNRGLQVLALNVGDSESDIQKTITGRDLDLAILVDTDSKMKERFDVFMLPSTFLIDAKGRLRGAFLGPLSAGRLHAEIRRLLDEKS